MAKTIISPREARDNAALRLDIQSKFKAYPEQRQTLLFDATGDLRLQVLQRKKAIFSLESQLWELLKEYCLKPNELSKNIRRLFTLSDELLEITRAVRDISLFDRLKDRFFLSFAICNEKQIVQDYLYGGSHDDRYTNHLQLKFWSEFIMALISTKRKVGSYQLGISETLENLIREDNAGLLNHMMNYPIRFTPRFTEKLLANIFLNSIEGENRWKEECLLEMKYIQIASLSSQNIKTKMKMMQKYKMF